MDSSGDLFPASAREIRSVAVKILVGYEGSPLSLQSYLRGSASGKLVGPEMQLKIRSLMTGVIRFRNTIDFLIARSTRRGQHSLPSETRSILRLSIYEARWLGIPMSRLDKLYQLHGMKKSVVAQAATLNLEEVTAGLSDVERVSIALSHPTFLVDTLLRNLPHPEAMSLMKANNEPTTHYLRLNRLKETDSDVVEDLCGQGILLEKDEQVEGLFRIRAKSRAIVESGYFKDGVVILQDKASVIAARTLNVQPGETVWDACAAPGMKTQLLWESMGADGQLIATDMSLHRLKKAIPRVSLMGGNGVDWFQTDASRSAVKRADKILIDAPCTSTGTLRGSPSFKWRLNKATLLSLMSIQNKILDGVVGAYSDRPGTEIVYATCSLLPHEGESQIDSLMSRFNVKLLNAGDLGARGYRGFKCSHAVRRFFPHAHDTNGFFICRFTT